MLTKSALDRIVGLLLPEMGDADARKALVESALFGCAVLHKVQWEGAARPFTVRLVRLLDEFGECTTGTRAIVALLEEVKGQVGANRHVEIDALLADLKASSRPRAAVSQPSPAVVTDSPYVFISYAREDEAVAARVEAFLKTARVRTFRDSDIPSGANWDMAIEQALRECRRMVLLLSPSSMPRREEVHREWFYFLREKKRIHPLLIQDCELHTRLKSLNYIDARNDLQGALERLVKDLLGDFPYDQSLPAYRGVTPVEETRSDLPRAMQSLLDKVRNGEGAVTLSTEEVNSIKDHRPADLTEFRLCRIAEWSLPRFYLDKRFVNLTLLLDKGESESQRWQRLTPDEVRFNDLRDVLERTKDDPALVLLGAPGSGKSTLLRRLQLDHCVDRLRDGEDGITFFIQLNEYHGEQKPRDWLIASWAERYPRLAESAPLESYLQRGRALLLLDALNEMQPKSGCAYLDLVAWWKEFTQRVAREGNRVIFSCRSLDYSATLSSKELPVPQVEVLPMSKDQVSEFIAAYSPEHEERIWNELAGSPQFSLFQTPYFLRLLCDQVAAAKLPKGPAGLFTGFVRKALLREIDGPMFQPGALLTERDHRKLSRDEWRDVFDLPERGLLIPELGNLAFTMQANGMRNERAQVRIDRDEACDLIAGGHGEAILQAGLALNVLDEIIARDEIAFFHQLLQEYFAARRLATEPKPELVYVEWAADKVRPSLEETLAGLAGGDPLPPLAQTGWEETTLTAAPMARDPEAFIRDLIPHNLPLAGRCAASPEVKIGDALKREIQQALIARTQDMKVDLRARIAAGEALGTIGDPRFERRTGPHGDYLFPPLVEISGGEYPIGDDDSDYEVEKPASEVNLAPFQIGRFPVTNAEYTFFIEAGGYEDHQWWDTTEAMAWLSGEGGDESFKQGWRDRRRIAQGWGEDFIRGLVEQNRWTPEQAESWIMFCNWTDERFDEQLDEWFPAGKVYRQPEFWEDTRFNSPSQPVVGVTWFEARAYCNWLTANAGSDASMKERLFRLPSEAEFEAAARGKKGRIFPYGTNFDASKSNTFESHIRRTAPVGVFDNATPEGAFDLTGNTWSWTLSIYDQQKFPYPYRCDHGREDVHQPGVNRVLRGGSWYRSRDFARAVCRDFSRPSFRGDGVGFRVVCSGLRPPSL